MVSGNAEDLMQREEPFELCRVLGLGAYLSVVVVVVLVLVVVVVVT